MPDYIDPEWEYWMPDLEVDSIVHRSHMASKWDLLEVWDKEKTEVRWGFRTGRGNPDSWLPEKLARPKRETESGPRLPPKICISCKKKFNPKRSSRQFCSHKCANAFVRAQTDRTKVKSMYMGGIKLKDIAVACNVSEATVSRVVRSDVGSDYKRPKGSTKRTDHEKVKSMYLSGARLKDIAYCCKTSLANVKKIVARVVDTDQRRPCGRKSRKEE